MPEQETVNTVTATTLSEVDTKVSAPVTDSSSDLKNQINQTTSKESAPKENTNVSKNKSPQQKLDTRSSDEIRKQIEASKRSGTVDGNSQALGNKEGSKDDGLPHEGSKEVEDKSKWFDPEKGFKTADDMKKSYAELQTKLTKQSEEVKLERSKLELEQAQIKAEVEKIKAVQAQRPLTPEEVQKQEAVKQWEVQNKEALDLIESKIAERLQAKQQAEKVQQTSSDIEKQILKERNDWLENFNKDEGRKKLWPVMEQVFREKGDTQESVTKDFLKNPLPYMEALALHKNFASIAEQIKAEAIQQYVAKNKEAAEVERKTKFALPGGPKSGSGDVDISKLSSAEIGSLLQRNENG